MGLTDDGSDSVSLIPLPSTRGVEVELGNMVAIED